MTTECKLPHLGENIESGDVVNVLVSEGDTISKGQPILELETDKAVVEVPADVEGKVEKIHVKTGDKVAVGEVILTLNGGEKPASKAKAARKEKEEEEEEEEEEEPSRRKKSEAAREKKEPSEEKQEAEEKEEEEEEEEESEKDGQQPEKEVTAAEQEEEEEEEEEEQEEEPDSSEEAGEEQEAEKTSPKAEARAAARRAEVVEFRDRKGFPEKETRTGRVAPASPAVRRMAREIGVDINEVNGSGPKGRITMEDVKAYSKQLHQARLRRPEAGGTIQLPDFSQFGEVESESFSNVRRKIARHLSVAWTSVPRVTHYERADVTLLEEARRRYARKAEAAGGKLTVTAILLKVSAAALKVFPKFNASIDVAAERIIYKKYVHIGVAVDTERGLLVPVIRDVNQKNIIQLSVELNQIAEKARRAKIAPDDLLGGCFTITNLGGIGGTGFSPIVNAPEVAILGVARSIMEPVWVEDEEGGDFEPRLMLPLSLSYDHRLIDGADAARFLRWIAEALEDPLLISLEG